MRQLFTDDWALIGTIDPDQNAVASPHAELLSDEIDMSDFDQVAFVLASGNFSAAGGTLAFKAVQAATAGGTYKDVTSASATTMTGSPNQDDSQQIIIVKPTDLDMDNNYRYVKASLTVGGSGNIDACVMAFGRRKHGPASDGDLATVLQIVNP